MVAGCKQKMAEELMNFVRNLTLTCYGKQRSHFEFETIWRTRAVILNLICYYLNIYYWFDVNKAPFWILNLTFNLLFE